MPSAPVPANRSSTRSAVQRAEDREQRLAHAVGGRAHVAPRAAPSACGRRSGRRRPSCRDGLGLDPGERGRRAARARARPGRGQRRAGQARRRGRAPAARRRRAAARSVKRASPDWRVPVSSPSPRSSRSISASRKPSECLASAFRRADSAGPKSRHSDGCSPAADAAAQLVQLADAVALGVLDQHHGRVGHVDADLDHRRRDQHVGVAGGERLHRGRLLARLHLPVQEHDVEVRELGRLQALVLRGGRARLQQLGLLHQRADDERLAAGAQLLADALVGARACALAVGDVRLDRLAALAAAA